MKEAKQQAPRQALDDAGTYMCWLLARPIRQAVDARTRPEAPQTLGKWAPSLPEPKQGSRLCPVSTKSDLQRLQLGDAGAQQVCLLRQRFERRQVELCLVQLRAPVPAT